MTKADEPTVNDINAGDEDKIYILHHLIRKNDVSDS